MNIVQYKVVLVGDGGVGKTTYVKKLRTAEFEKKYVATLGVEVHPITFKSTCGTIRFNIWDTAGQEKLGGMREGYYMKADAIIAMYDGTSIHTRNNITNWVRDVRRVVGADCPLVVVCNKSDINELTPMNEYQHITHSISVKTSTKIYEPLLHLAKELMDDPTLEWIDDPTPEYGDGIEE